MKRLYAVGQGNSEHLNVTQPPSVETEDDTAAVKDRKRRSRLGSAIDRLQTYGLAGEVIGLLRYYGHYLGRVTSRTS